MLQGDADLGIISITKILSFLIEYDFSINSIFSRTFLEIFLHFYFSIFLGLFYSDILLSWYSITEANPIRSINPVYKFFFFECFFWKFRPKFTFLFILLISFFNKIQTRVPYKPNYFSSGRKLF